jgi:hypothetical protein
VEGKNYEPAWLEVKLFVAARLSYGRDEDGNSFASLTAARRRLDASRPERTVQKR